MDRCRNFSMQLLLLIDVEIVVLLNPLTDQNRMANSVDPVLMRWLIMSCLIRINTVCHSLFDFSLKPLFAAVDMLKFKNGRLHFRHRDEAVNILRKVTYLLTMVARYEVASAVLILTCRKLISNELIKYHFLLLLNMLTLLLLSPYIPCLYK